MSIGLVGKDRRLYLNKRGKTQPRIRRFPFVPAMGLTDVRLHLLGRLLNVRIPKPQSLGQRVTKMFRKGGVY